MDLEIVSFKPSHTKDEAKKFYKNSQNWRDYLNSKYNPFMQKSCAYNQYNVCPVCQKHFRSDQKKVLHHIDYMHECTYMLNKRYAKIPLQTDKNSIKVVVLPNCQECARHNYQDFLECQNRLIYIHEDCHSSLEDNVKANSVFKNFQSKK